MIALFLLAVLFRHRQTVEGKEHEYRRQKILIRSQLCRCDTVTISKSPMSSKSQAMYPRNMLGMLVGPATVLRLIQEIRCKFALGIGKCYKNRNNSYQYSVSLSTV